jgi:tRNA 2-thiouridine synthesizing protein A
MPETHHKLNALGLLCPLPVLLASREMKELAPGQVLEITGDDPALHIDIPAWCHKAGHRLLEIEEDEGVIVCYVEKGTAAPS